jgi:hypothetical protein
MMPEGQYKRSEGRKFLRADGAWVRKLGGGWCPGKRHSGAGNSRKNGTKSGPAGI